MVILLRLLPLSPPVCLSAVRGSPLSAPLAASRVPAASSSPPSLGAPISTLRWVLVQNEAETRTVLLLETVILWDFGRHVLEHIPLQRCIERLHHTQHDALLLLHVILLRSLVFFAWNPLHSRLVGTCKYITLEMISVLSFAVLPACRWRPLTSTPSMTPPVRTQPNQWLAVDPLFRSPPTREALGPRALRPTGRGLRH